jgi:hypothetical protein
MILGRVAVEREVSAMVRRAFGPTCNGRAQNRVSREYPPGERKTRIHGRATHQSAAT